MSRHRLTTYAFPTGSAISGRFRCLLESRGISVTRSPLAHSTQRLRLLRTGNITTVLDVGANSGEYGRSLRWAGYRGQIISYEPMQTAFEALQRRTAPDPKWLCRRVALGAKSGTAALHVAGDQVSSSLLPQLPQMVRAAPKARYEANEPVNVVALDEEQHRWSPHERLFLKLDVQGYEAQVLRGATGTLDSVAGIEMELSLEALYDGQALLQEQLATLRDLSFELVSMENVFVDQGVPRLLQVDGLFARRRG